MPAAHDNEGHTMRSTPQSPARPARLRKVALLSTVALAGVLTLAACSSSSKTASQPSAASPSGAAGGGTGGGTRQGGPAASGLAAAITGNTIEVQNPSTGQVSVTFSATTRFTQAKKVNVASIVAGDCVTASAVAAAGSSASSAPATQPTSFTATTITVSTPVNGSCTLGGFGGGRPSGAPTGARPSGAPSGGTGAGRARFGTFASGKVLSVAGGTLTVQGTNRSTGTSTTYTISTTGATTVTTTAATTSAALKVGECVSANGPADSTGTVAATRIALSTPGPNGCTTGFGRFGGGTGGANA
jgi:hypothetical protein